MYYPLLLHLHLRAFTARRLALEAEVRTACETLIGQLWASDSSDRDQVECGSADAPDAALNAWNYNELVGLHAIANLALLAGDSDL